MKIAIAEGQYFEAAALLVDKLRARFRAVHFDLKDGRKSRETTVYARIETDPRQLELIKEFTEGFLIGLQAEKTWMKAGDHDKQTR
jgi:hypothetical protein